jgi:tyrosyl-tRNA synthetase
MARMMEREDFRKRFAAGDPLGVHEFLYPLMQGYDSVAIAADVELGGTDQIFNLLVGRDLQRAYGNEPQVVITMPLLVGTDGIQKMSKSYGNAVGIADSPREMFGKLMSISDELMWTYYELLSDLAIAEIEELKQKVVMGELHPKIAKESIAMEIVERFHSEDVAMDAREEFERVFSRRENPENIPEIVVTSTSAEMSLVNVIVEAKLCSSKTEARRMIQQGAVEFDGERMSDIAQKVENKGEKLLKVGKRRFARIRFS